MSSAGRALALLALGGAAGLLVNRLRPGGVSLLAFEAPAACSAASPSHAAPLEMAATEAASLCGRAAVVFVDTRPESRYVEGHVAEAIHLPCEQSESIATLAMGRLEQARTVIVYGQSTGEAAGVAATLQRRLPGASVRVLGGGFAAWEADGLACASGPCGECMATRKEGAP